MSTRLSIAAILSLAAVCVFGADEAFVNAVGFDRWPADTLLKKGATDAAGDVTSDPTKCFFAYEPREEGENDASSSTAYGKGTSWEGPEVVSTNGYAVGRPDTFADTANINFLTFCTGYGVLYRTFRSVDENFQRGPADDPAYNIDLDVQTGLYIDQMIQFTPVTSRTDAGRADEDDKLALWFQETTNVYGKVTGTNLCCRAQVWTWSEVDGTLLSSFENLVLEPEAGSLPLAAGQWYRLTVKAVRNVLQADEYGILSAFSVYVNGVAFRPVNKKYSFTDAFRAWCNEDWGEGKLITEETDALLARGVLLGSLQEMRAYYGSSYLGAVGYEGEGLLDDLTVTDRKPVFLGGELPPYVDFTLAWDGHVTAFTYTLMRGALRVAEPTRVLTASEKGKSITVQNRLFPDNHVEVTDILCEDGYTEGTRSAEGHVTIQEEAFYVTAVDPANKGTLGSAEHTFTGAGTAADPYRIGGYADLALFRKQANAKALPTDVCFRQTADVTLDPDFPWTPIASFSGVYDGAGHSVSGARLVPAGAVDWVGFFNKLTAAEIRDFTLKDVAPGEELDNVALLCGQTESTVTLRGVTVTGGLSARNRAGGLVGYADGTLALESCTNNAGVSALREAGGFICEVAGETTVTAGRSRRAVTVSNEVYYAAAGGLAALVENKARLTVDGFRMEGPVKTYLNRALPEDGSYAVAGGVVGDHKGADGLSLSAAVVTGNVSLVCNELPRTSDYGGVGGLVGRGAAALTNVEVTAGAELAVLVHSNETHYAVGAFVGYLDDRAVTAGGTRRAPEGYWPTGDPEGTSGLTAGVVTGATVSWLDTYDAAFRAVAPSGCVRIARRPDTTLPVQRMTLSVVMAQDGKLVTPTTFDVEPTDYEIGLWLASGYEVARSGDVWVVREAAPTMVDFYITLDDSVSAVRYVIGTSEVTNDYTVTGPFEVLPDTPVSLIPTCADWHENPAVRDVQCAATEGLVVTPNGTGTARVTVYADLLDPGAVVKRGASPADLGITEGPFAALAAGAPEMSNLVAWVECYGVSVAAVNALTAEDDAFTAYLLNVDPARVDTSSANFSFAAAAFDGTTLVMTCTDKDGKTVDLGAVNGHWGLNVSKDLMTWRAVPALAADHTADPLKQDVTPAVAADDRFFRAFLSLEAVPAE